MEPTNVAVGSMCRLLAPGKIDEKRNFLKPRYDGADEGIILSENVIVVPQTVE